MNAKSSHNPFILAPSILSMKYLMIRYPGGISQKFSKQDDFFAITLHAPLMIQFKF